MRVMWGQTWIARGRHRHHQSLLHALLHTLLERLLHIRRLPQLMILLRSRLRLLLQTRHLLLLLVVLLW
jgi:hypothetical protein